MKDSPKITSVEVTTFVEWRYRLRAVSDIKLNKEEHSEYRWLPIDEEIETDWYWTKRDAIKQLKADRG